MSDEPTAAPVALDEVLPALDIAGQPGGPSLEEQARVDEEQRQLMARIRAEVAEAAEAERAAGNDVESKIARAAAKAIVMQGIPDRIAELERQLADLVAKAG